MAVSPTAHATERARFVEDLLDFMTVEEKAGQLVLLAHASADRRNLGDRLRRGQLSGIFGHVSPSEISRLQRIAIEETRLGIPLFFADETGRGNTAIVPAPISLTASWDEEVASSAEAIVAQEARNEGLNWAIAPEISLAPSPNDEGLASSHGTSPYLAERLAIARIKGLQALGEHGGRTIACLRLDQSGWSDRRDDRGRARQARLILNTLHASQPGSVALDASAQSRIDLADKSTDTFSFLSRPGGYQGIVLSEWNELARLAGQSSGPLPYLALSVEAVVAAVRDGRIPSSRLDDAVRRVLGAKFDLGLFRYDSPHTYSAAGSGEWLDPDMLARKIARKCIVLLRNEPALLPLSADSGDLLVVGAAASDRRLPTAPAHGDAASLLDGLDELGIPYKYVPGLALRQNEAGSRTGRLIDADRMAIGMAGEAARRSRTVLVALGDVDGIGEAHRVLLETITATNDKVILLTMGPRPFDPEIGGKRVPAVIHAGLLGSMSGHAIADVLTGKYAPQGHLPFSMEENGRVKLPLGHGLSYSEFTLTEFGLEMGAERILASALLTNAGERDGSRAIQLYIRKTDLRERARVSLCGFQRHSLMAGEARRITFEIGADDLGRYGADGRFVVEAGHYEIAIGLDATHALRSQIALPQAIIDAMIRRRATGGTFTVPGNYGARSG